MIRPSLPDLSACSPTYKLLSVLASALSCISPYLPPLSLSPPVALTLLPPRASPMSDHSLLSQFTGVDPLFYAGPFPLSGGSVLKQARLSSRPAGRPRSLLFFKLCSEKGPCSFCVHAADSHVSPSQQLMIALPFILCPISFSHAPHPLLLPQCQEDISL